MIDITQPKPRNIGLMNTQNTNPTIEAMMIATTLATLFMRLRLEMDALPRLSDMLLFVFIVRHFFMRLSAIEVLLARYTHRAAGAKGCSPSAEKYKLTAGRSGDFFHRKAKNIPVCHVQQTEQAITSIVDRIAINRS